MPNHHTFRAEPESIRLSKKYRMRLGMFLGIPAQPPVFPRGYQPTKKGEILKMLGAGWWGRARLLMGGAPQCRARDGRRPFIFR